MNSGPELHCSFRARAKSMSFSQYHSLRDLGFASDSDPTIATHWWTATACVAVA